MHHQSIHLSIHWSILPQGVLPNDECLNMLIRVCIAGKRLEEALDLVKGAYRGWKHCMTAQQQTTHLH